MQSTKVPREPILVKNFRYMKRKRATWVRVVTPVSNLIVSKNSLMDSQTTNGGLPSGRKLNRLQSADSCIEPLPLHDLGNE